MRVWIFDLDNTLHDAEPHIFPHINRSMTEYVARHLDLDFEQAGRLRNHYWLKYGATLKGLMLHHGTRPEHFLAKTHEFPDLAQMVLPDPALRKTLLALRGKKYIYSNAPGAYAREVLKILGVEDLFCGVFSIESARYLPKPQTAGFLRLLRKIRVRPSSCVMVEDTAENLRTAKRLGMKTVWISKTLKKPPYVDVKLTALAHLLRRQRLI